MKKILLTILILVLISAGSIFAQSGEGFIKTTFGFGYQQYSEDGGDDMSSNLFFADIDVINSFGLTVAFQGIMVWGGDFDSDEAYTVIPIGIGYTFVRDKWNVGAKFMALGGVGGGMKALGFEASGNYWFFGDLGLGAAFNFYFAEDATMWLVRAGVSMRF